MNRLLHHLGALKQFLAHLGPALPTPVISDGENLVFTHVRTLKALKA